MTLLQAIYALLHMQCVAMVLTGPSTDYVAKTVYGGTCMQAIEIAKALHGLWLVVR